VNTCDLFSNGLIPSTGATREAPRPTMATGISSVSTTDREAKWRREQRWRELQAIEEEHLRGKLTVLACAHSSCAPLVRLVARFA
jgi:hypothetical protein